MDEVDFKIFGGDWMFGNITCLLAPWNSEGGGTANWLCCGNVPTGVKYPLCGDCNCEDDDENGSC